MNHKFKVGINGHDHKTSIHWVPSQELEAEVLVELAEGFMVDQEPVFQWNSFPRLKKHGC